VCGVVAAIGDVSAALALVAHRGIRNKTAHCAGGAQLGHARLPILVDKFRRERWPT
jgi:asparagine synthetase B (glutamine-hydrolysing)